MENLEYIFPQDLKMWAKSAGRKFLEAQDKIKALSTKNISAIATINNKRSKTATLLNSQLFQRDLI